MAVKVLVGPGGGFLEDQGNSETYVTFDNKTIVTDSEGIVSTAIGGYKEAEIEIVNGELTYNSSVSGFTRSISDDSSYSSLDTFSATIKGTFNVNVDGTLYSLVIDTTAVFEGEAASGIWETVVLALVPATGGDVSVNILVTSSNQSMFPKIVFFDASEELPDPTAISNVKLAITITNYHTIDSNFIPIDNNTIVINSNGKLATSLESAVESIGGYYGEITLGNNLSISNNELSATDTTYSAGTNIDITNNVISATSDSSKLDATKCTYQTTAPTAAISDGGVHIVYLSDEPATKYDGYIYMIAEA